MPVKRVTQALGKLFEKVSQRQANKIVFLLAAGVFFVLLAIAISIIQRGWVVVGREAPATEVEAREGVPSAK